VEVDLTSEEVAQIRGVLAAVSHRAKLNVELERLDFDYNVLRILVNTQRRRLKKNHYNDEGFQELSRITGLSGTALRKFCHGTSTPTVRTVIRLMAWVGYSDLEDFLTEE